MSFRLVRNPSDIMVAWGTKARKDRAYQAEEFVDEGLI